jgi:hypothetical protein
MPPAGPQAQGWTGTAKTRGWIVAEVSQVHPPAISQGSPSRLNPWGEGRSDGRVLHLHPRGLARYPEGGRRREDEPSPAEARVRANVRQAVPWTRGCRPGPRVYGLAAPVFPSPCVLRGRGKSSPCTPSQAATAPFPSRARSGGPRGSLMVTRSQHGAPTDLDSGTSPGSPRRPDKEAIVSTPQRALAAMSRRREAAGQMP